MCCSTRLHRGPCAACRRRAQTSIEFVVLFGFAMIFFLTFFVIIQQNSLTAQEAQTDAQLREVQHLVTSEFDIAAASSDGYSRVFALPERISGVNYSVELIDGQEIVIHFKGQELVTFLAWNATGNLSTGSNLIEKPEGAIIVEPLP